MASRSQEALRLIDLPPVHLHMEIAQLAERTQFDAPKPTIAFEHDADLALFVCVADEEIDEICRALNESLMDEMRRDPSLVEPSLAFLWWCLFRAYC